MPTKTPVKKVAAKKTTKKAAGKTSAKQPAGKCGNWRAVQDNMPPLPSRLYVTGECKFPTPGYKVTLKEANPQGINPAILLLKKTVTQPTGPVIQKLTVVKVRFDKKKAKIKYQEVTILPDGTRIKVQQVF